MIDERRILRAREALIEALDLSRDLRNAEPPQAGELDMRYVLSSGVLRGTVHHVLWLLGGDVPEEAQS